MLYSLSGSSQMTGNPISAKTGKMVVLFFKIFNSIVSPRRMGAGLQVFATKTSGIIPHWGWIQGLLWSWVMDAFQYIITFFLNKSNNRISKNIRSVLPLGFNALFLRPPPITPNPHPIPLSRSYWIAWENEEVFVLSQDSSNTIQGCESLFSHRGQASANSCFVLNSKRI